MKVKKIKQEYESGIQSKNRLLEAGMKVFAEEGYYNTKVSDICKLAKLNETAVNYHFGSKEGLYKAIWENIADNSRANPPRHTTEKKLTAKQRLSLFVCTMVDMNFEKGDVWLFSRLHLMEVLQPTGLMGAHLAETMRKSIVSVEEIITEFIPDISRNDLSACTYIIFSLCRSIYCNTEETLEAEYSITLTDNYIEHLKNDITDVCLASIDVYRQRYSQPNKLNNPQKAIK